MRRGRLVRRRRGIFGDVQGRAKEREREVKRNKARRKIRNKDVAHSENRGGAEWPDGAQEHPLGVKTWYSLKWSSEREGGINACKKLVGCSMHVCARVKE